MPDDHLLTAKEAASYLHVHPNTIKRMVKRGDLAAYRIGDRGDLRIRREHLDDLLAKSREPQEVVGYANPDGSGEGNW